MEGFICRKCGSFNIMAAAIVETKTIMFDNMPMAAPDEKSMRISEPLYCIQCGSNDILKFNCVADLKDIPAASKIYNAYFSRERKVRPKIKVSK